MAPDAATEAPKLTETPEFKEALQAAIKTEREQLEKTIRESNQRHLEEERKKLEALYGPGAGGKPAEPPPSDGKDFFAVWGEKHGLPADAGLELAQGVIDYVDRTLVAPLAGSQRRSELRLQRQDVRASDPALAKLDDKYHEEVLKLLETVKVIHADSYAAALELVIGRHVKDVLEEDRKGRGAAEPPETPRPGPTPTPSIPRPKGKVELNAYQKERAGQMGLSEEDFAALIVGRAKSMKERGFSEPAIRQQLGKDLGSLAF